MSSPLDQQYLEQTVAYIGSVQPIIDEQAAAIKDLGSKLAAAESKLAAAEAARAAAETKLAGAVKTAQADANWSAKVASSAEALISLGCLAPADRPGWLDKMAADRSFALTYMVRLAKSASVKGVGTADTAVTTTKTAGSKCPFEERYGQG